MAWAFFRGHSGDCGSGGMAHGGGDAEDEASTAIACEDIEAAEGGLEIGVGWWVRGVDEDKTG